MKFINKLNDKEKQELLDKIVIQLCKEDSSFNVNGSYAVRLILKSVGKPYRFSNDLDVNCDADDFDKEQIIEKITDIIKNIDKNYEIEIQKKEKPNKNNLTIKIIDKINESDLIKIDFKAITNPIEIDIVNGNKIQRITTETAIAKKIIAITDPDFIGKNGRYKDIDDLNYLLKNVDFCMDDVYKYMFKKEKIKQLKPLNLSKENLNKINTYLNNKENSLRNVLNLPKITDTILINNFIKELLEPVFTKYTWSSQLERALPKEDYDRWKKHVKWEKQQKKNKQNDKQTTNKSTTTKQDTKSSSKNKDDEIEFS